MEYYLLTFSIIPLFVGRAALPIFATALFGRFGQGLDVGWLGFFEDVTAVDLLDNIPAWATQDEVLVVLGVFALVEFLLRHIPETRFLIDGVSDSTVKGIAAGACSFLLVGGDLAGLVDIWLETGDLTNFEWGLGLQYTWSFGIGVAVFGLASARLLLWDFVESIDPDGELGVSTAMTWAESSVGFLGIFFVFILPGLTAIAAAVGILAAWLTTRALRAAERASFEDCENCGAPGPRCAPACASCSTPRLRVHSVGVLGRVTDSTSRDAHSHRFDLIAVHRCPHCGHRLRGSGPSQDCHQCGRSVFDGDADRAAYVGRMSQRLPSTLLVCLLFSSVPLVGLLPGYFYYRLTLLSGLSIYMPRTSRFGRRWVLRLVKFGLLFVQWVPGLGALTLPVICYVDFRIARRALSPTA